ncbi:TcpQ domain-containing protein [Eoetvoesiella caeni]|uniref:Conjugative transfer protein CagX n=1 Tax=Eoetvoesiella caeni TaxID=645616 RepID=A0A366HH55_9BURK|nr:TcpQ domain-containing protein [Eoetvoesiella caeni]MCI2808388.1 TcpQ domain-containing protein [Eoetvoesiella caeni]RBP41098.1 conjugative transfer protein CagX [Eoetvoesiella caeni]
MLAKYAAALAVLLLGGCAGLPDWKLFAGPKNHTSVAGSGEFDFSWRLSGEPSVAPLQVFDNGRRMWLQFAPEQPIPAVFARTAEGDRLLEYRREGPYVVLDHVWPHLLLRGGMQSSRIDRIVPGSSVYSNPEAGPEPMAPDVAAPVASVGAAEPAGRPVAAELAVAGELAATPADSVRATPLALSRAGSLSLAYSVPSVTAIDVADAADTASTSVPDISSHMAGAAYDVSPKDQNMRLALVRWAGLAGWTFDAEHWSVDADIPIAGSARFQLDFKQAVQALMAATELADRPLQPCFYSNKVLRIVPYAQPCNRVASLSGNS